MGSVRFVALSLLVGGCGDNAGAALDAGPDRPVDVAVARDGTLLVTSDASGVIIAISQTR
ncbi:MAG TPA: hypothetical protein VLX92_21760 [Kofleriaceae bacterium]|nr:hypothetical protein [Kofleriaceae bacterium]